MNPCVQCAGVRGVKAAVGGWDFSIVLLEDGRVLSAGANKYLQLGVKGNYLYNIVYFTLSPFHYSLPLFSVNITLNNGG